MADENKDDKTEQASQRRLRSAWDEGQIPQGRDVVMAAAVAAGIGALVMSGHAFSDSLVALVSETLRALPDPDPMVVRPQASRPALIAFAICAAATLAGAAAGLAQTKGNVWPNLAVPDLSRLTQGARLKRLVSREMLADLGLSFVKVMALSAVLWHVARADFLTLGKLILAPPGAMLEGAFAPLARGATKVVVTLIVLAGVELAVARRRYSARMKMTRDEAKREYREEEGDPLLRSRRRRRHRDLAKGHARIEVPKADALIVNPTHIAIAVRYRKDEGKAPRVTAKGKGELAEHMRDLARSNGIPIVEDIALARLLWKRVKVGREVPAETYRAVAAILAFVYRITGRSQGLAA